NKISVKKGDKVKIIFKNSAGFHDLVIDEYGVATKQAQAPDTEVLEFTATKTGSFEYYCSVGSHRAMGMVGILTVE
nr:cytochrome C oxidase subunit II [Candidatus Paceibacterota bacterium]